MEEKQKKNRYDAEFFRSITKRVKEKGLLEKSVITSGEILGIIADTVGQENYQPKSGLYILNKWGESVKSILTKEKRTVYSQEKERKVNVIVFVPINKEDTFVQPAKTNEEKRMLIRNVITVLDRQAAARNNEIYVPNLREMWNGDTENSGIALLCKAAKVLRSTFGFGFTYDYNKIKKVVRIQDAHGLRERLMKQLPPMPKEKEDNGVKLNQFVRLTDVAADAIYLMGVAINKSHRGLEVYSLAKFLSEAPSLVTKSLAAADIKTLVRTVGSEYFTLTNGSDIINLTVDGWEKIQKRFDPKDRIIEILALTREKNIENMSILNEEIGLCSILIDCSWESFKKLARYVYTGKITLPVDKKLEERLIKDVENDLLEIAMKANPFI